MDALLRCSRYAFGPNRLHHCGPARNTEMRDYIKDDASDLGLREMLQDFNTMYPYLLHIARANNIRDPLDDRVVEAYWIGNELLENVTKNDLYWHLIDGLSLKKKLGKSFALVEEKVAGGAVPHHSFHVLDIGRRTGHIEREQTLENMDECRVSWGRITNVAGPRVTVLRQPLCLEGTQIMLGKAQPRIFVRSLESEYDIEQLAPGDLVSIHWGVICEVLSPKQTASLKKYTVRHIALHNQNLF